MTKTLTSGQVNHGAGVRALRAAISAHRCGQQAAVMTDARGICPGGGQFNVGVATGRFEMCMRCELLAHRDPPATPAGEPINKIEGETQ